MPGSVQVSQVKRYYPGEEHTLNEHPRKSLEDKPTEDVPKNSHEDRTTCYMTTGSTLTSEEGNYDIENHGLTLIEEKNELIQNIDKVQSAANFSTSEDKAMEISDKINY